MQLERLSITVRGRRYAIRELARRAGVEQSFFDAWRISVGPRETLVELPLPARPRLRFQHAEPAHFARFFRGSREHRVARASFHRARPAGARHGDFLVPFSEPGASEGEPLFRVSGAEAHARLDLLASTLLTLSRAEELLPGQRDAWCRFPARASALGEAGAVERPIVDELGAALRCVLEELAPGWSPVVRRASLHVSHDLDEVGLPFRLRQTLGHSVRRGSWRASLRDMAACLTPAAPGFLHALRELVQENLARGVTGAVYVKASARTPFDSGYALDHPKLRPILHWLRDRNVELGVHPSHFTLGEPARLRREVAAIRHFLGGAPLGGRQHHLRWSPRSWLDWERAGLAYDSSVGFADAPGFRAGTCVPYRPWLLWLDREAELLELPLIVMDTTLFRYQRLGPERASDTVLRLLDVVRSIGGVFTLLWHNTNFLRPDHVRTYQSLLGSLAVLEQFDVKGALR